MLSFHITLQALLWTAANALDYGVGRGTAKPSCRCFPGESCWPSSDIWNAFNTSLDGKLISTVPLASPCHEDSVTGYNAELCVALQDNWFNPVTHISSASSVMAPFFGGQSCNPFLNRSTPCTIGNDAVYAVNATSAEDYQQTLAFAKAHNIRLVIRNTGHDYNGKSTGAGSLALWTTHIKTQQLKQHSASHYTGPAFRFEYADSYGFVVVAGNEPTVGLVGGYTQGGGHGPLASRFGLAADQLLEWEVVLPASQVVVVAAPGSQYEDLYWALCGGGGGTFAAVLSVTIKAHPAMSLSTASLEFVIADNASDSTADSFFALIGSFTRQVPAINDAGAVAIWFITAKSFTLQTLFGPNLTTSHLDQLLQPVLSDADRFGMQYTYDTTFYSSFLKGFSAQPVVNVSQLNIGGRLIPRALIESGSSVITAVIRNITSSGALFSGVSFNVSQYLADSIAANPYWRDSVMDAVVANYWSYTDSPDNIASINAITRNLLPQMEDLTPKGGAYLNEADFQQIGWQQVFYGAHYEKLSQIKSKYDPDDVFYALGAVGSERWIRQPDGRLCRANETDGIIV
ncbi:FAD-binding domain-containing protein [Xylariaceae sp. FL0255]|nr:FAD-binding domain-containing protein [Xylariaceae sp. FL0255]